MEAKDKARRIRLVKQLIVLRQETYQTAREDLEITENRNGKLLDSLDVFENNPTGAAHNSSHIAAIVKAVPHVNYFIRFDGERMRYHIY